MEPTVERSGRTATEQEAETLPSRYLVDNRIESGFYEVAVESGFEYGRVEACDLCMANGTFFGPT